MTLLRIGMSHQTASCRCKSKNVKNLLHQIFSILSRPIVFYISYNHLIVSTSGSIQGVLRTGWFFLGRVWLQNSFGPTINWILILSVGRRIHWAKKFIFFIEPSRKSGALVPIRLVHFVGFIAIPKRKRLGRKPCRHFGTSMLEVDNGKMLKSQ